MSNRSIFIGAAASIAIVSAIVYFTRPTKTVNRRATYLVETFSGKKYYVSAAGNTTNSGLDVDHTWSLTKLLTSSSTIAAGDSILFKRGDIFYGTLEVGKSGTSGSSIVYGAYGAATLPKPIISASIPITSWTSVGTNIYESDSIAGGLSAVNLVTAGGLARGMGRYPNLGTANGGYLSIDAVSTNKSITDADLPDSPDWQGADVVIRTQKYVMDRMRITDHSTSNVLTYSGGIITPTVGFGYFIENDSRTLDANYEWYWNPTRKRLRMYFSSGAPQNVKVATKTFGINLSTKSYIKLVNLAVDGANESGINITSGQDNSVINCTVTNSGGTGVYAYNSINFKAQYDSVMNSQNNGIDAAFGTTNSIISNNYIRSTYFIAGMGGSGQAKGLGINIRGVGTLCENNQIINSGFISLYFNQVNNITVRNNLIDSFCIVKDDGGGIYCYNEGSYISSGRVLKNNIIRHGIGTPFGVPTQTGVFSITTFGIYIDLGSNGILVQNNYLQATGRGGFYLRPRSNNVQIYDNTVYNCYYLFYVVRDGTSDVYNYNIKRNVFFGSTSNVTGTAILNTNVKLENFSNSLRATVGKMDSNWYASLAAKDYPFEIKSNKYSLTGWRTATNFDLKSTQKTFAPTDTLKAAFATSSVETVDLGTYNWTDAKGVTYSAASNPLILQPYTSAVLVRGTNNGGSGCVGSCPTISITTDKTTYTAPAKIIISATVGDTDGSVVSTTFYFNGKTLYTDNTAPFSCTWSNVPKGTYNFTAKAKDNDGNVTTSATVTRTVN